MALADNNSVQTWDALGLTDSASGLRPRSPDSFGPLLPQRGPNRWLWRRKAIGRRNWFDVRRGLVGRIGRARRRGITMSRSIGLGFLRLFDHCLERCNIVACERLRRGW